MVLYLGSDAPLPRVPWRDDAPGFHVQELGEHERPARARLPLPHVVYAGAHEGCGCGFQLGELPDPAHDEDAPARRASLRALADYVEARLRAGARVELYACWSGDEGEPVEHHRALSVADLRGDDFALVERERSTMGLA
jgi:hypothetical protein